MNSAATMQPERDIVRPKKQFSRCLARSRQSGWLKIGVKDKLDDSIVVGPVLVIGEKKKRK
jgi:hypothetical protein